MGKYVNGEYISEVQDGSRILRHGQITSLTAAFSLTDNKPFTIYVRPKSAVTVVDIMVSVKCQLDSAAAVAPFRFNEWSPLSLIQVGATAIDLATYDVYWGTGF